MKLFLNTFLSLALLLCISCSQNGSSDDKVKTDQTTTKADTHTLPPAQQDSSMVEVNVSQADTKTIWQFPVSASKRMNFFAVKLGKPDQVIETLKGAFPKIQSIEIDQEMDSASITLTSPLTKEEEERFFRMVFIQNYTFKQAQ